MTIMFSQVSRRLAAFFLFVPVLSQADELAAKNPADAFVVRKTHYTGGDYDNETFKYLLLTPETIEPGKTYPLVLFLHGAGERGDNVELLKKHFLGTIASPEYRKKYPCFVVAPQCRAGKKWSEPSWEASGSPAMSKEPTDMLRMALQIVDETIAKQPIDSDRLYLTGISMGGYGSWDLAARQPNRWAAVAPICGGGDPVAAKKLVGVPLWAFHGDADPAVPVERSRQMIAAIKAAGGDPQSTEYPGVAHDSWTQAYADPNGLLPWMFSQHK